MGLFDSIEKLITEHGSAAIIGQQLEFAKEQFDARERKVSELQIENGKLQAQLQREQLDHEKVKQELQRLQKEHEEDIRIESGIEFRRGKRTNGRWRAFCPVCHLPADTSVLVKCPNPKCGWQTSFGKKQVEEMISQLATIT